MKNKLDISYAGLLYFSKVFLQELLQDMTCPMQMWSFGCVIIIPFLLTCAHCTPLASSLTPISFKNMVWVNNPRLANSCTLASTRLGWPSADPRRSLAGGLRQADWRVHAHGWGPNHDTRIWILWNKFLILSLFYSSSKSTSWTPIQGENQKPAVLTVVGVGLGIDYGWIRLDLVRL